MKYRPPYSDLPKWFRKAKGDLTKLAPMLGYSAKQIRRWINDAHPDIKAGLETELEAARQEAKRGSEFRSDLPISLPLSEVKHLLRTYYSTPWPELESMDKFDFEAMNLRADRAPDETGEDTVWVWRNEKSTSIRTKPNPSTGETLHQLLSWADVKSVASTLNEADTHVIMDMLGFGGLSALAIRMRADDLPYPVVTKRQKEEVLKRIYQRLAPLMIKRPYRLALSREEIDTFYRHQQQLIAESKVRQQLLLSQ